MLGKPFTRLRFAFWILILAGLGALTLLYQRSWPFPPWIEYPATYVIEIQALWDAQKGLVNPAVRYASSHEKVKDPLVRYEVLRQAKVYIKYPTEPGGTVNASGSFKPNRCPRGDYYTGWLSCQEFSWEWLAPRYAQPPVGDLIDEYPLFTAAGQGRLDDLKKLLLHGTDVEERDTYGRTAIFYARAPEAAQILVDAGADVQAKDKRGATPLMSAAFMRDLTKVKWLLTAGANPNLRSNEGRTALHHAARQRLFRQDLPGTEAVKLLLEAGADPNIRDNEGNTVLMFAATDGQLEEVQALLAAGAKVNLRSKAGKTALSIASDKGYTEIVQLLKKHGARI